MAWTDQCKIDACTQIDRRKEQLGGVRKTLRHLSKESGIPYNTLKRWYYPPSVVKNDNTLPKPDKSAFETCANSDLERLIKAGKKFGTIYADPPWKYSNQATRAATDNHYQTLTPEEIAALPIQEIVKDQAHLHLWTTNAFLFECPKILEAWGFEYKGVFVWVKNQMGIGNYWRVSHEFMILGVRGGLRFFDNSQMSWVLTNRTKHSTKPEIVANTIEKISPGPYLELFGRQTRENWTVWGDEIEKTLFNEAAFEKKRIKPI